MIITQRELSKHLIPVITSSQHLRTSCLPRDDREYDAAKHSMAQVCRHSVPQKDTGMLLVQHIAF